MKIDEKLLQCALEEFAVHGFEGASIRAIAGCADVTHAVIRYHFGTKEQLWQAAVRFLFERMNSQLAGLHAEDEGADERQKLFNWVRRYVNYCARHPEHARIMMHASMSDSNRLGWAVEHFIKPGQADLAGAFDFEIYVRKELNVSREKLFMMLTSISQWPFMAAPDVRLSLGIDMLDPQQIEEHAETVIALFFET